jgi:MFS family permease
LTGVATAVAPLIGGYLIDAVSWRAAFLLNIPIGAFVVAVSGRVPESRDPTATGRLDARGAVLAALALGGTTYALIEGPDRGMAAGILIAGATGLVALIAFVLAERREANPMLPLGIFASAQFRAANVITLASTRPSAAFSSSSFRSCRSRSATRRSPPGPRRCR